MDILAAEGIDFVTSAHIGQEGDPSIEEIRDENDAVILAMGATKPRDYPCQRGLGGSFAMDFLHANTEPS